MSLYEFMCGGLSGLRSRKTTAYTIGGEVRIVTASSSRTLPGRKQVSIAEPERSHNASSRHEMVEGSWSPNSGYYHLPYSYGNPVVNLGANVLLRSIQILGLGPKEDELPYD